MGQKKKIQPPNSRESALPTLAHPIVLNLSGNEVIFEDGKWRQGKRKPSDSDFKDASSYGEVTREAFEELHSAETQVQELQERNNMLEFKMQLLINMVCAQPFRSYSIAACCKQQ